MTSVTAPANPRLTHAPLNMPGRGPYKRLARQFREAGLRATPQEIVDLVDLERMVRRDDLCVFQAQEIVRRMIRRQHAREMHERAA